MRALFVSSLLLVYTSVASEDFADVYPDSVL